MIALGLAPKKSSNSEEILKKRPDCTQNGTSEEAKKLAAAALAAVRDATFASTAGKGKVEVSLRSINVFPYGFFFAIVSLFFCAFLLRKLLDPISPWKL